jgi:hypothetical protein
VTGTLQPVLTVMPTNLKTLTWSFATGEGGSENWAGIQPNALVCANVQNWDIEGGQSQDIINNLVQRVVAAIAAAEDLHSFYGTPYANIELTPMIGGNDTQQ